MPTALEFVRAAQRGDWNLDRLPRFADMGFAPAPCWSAADGSSEILSTEEDWQIGSLRQDSFRQFVDNPGKTPLPAPSGYRRAPDMRIQRARENVFTVTATSQELSALVAAARMAFEAMRSAPEPPPAGVLDTLERVLSDFDRARERLDEESREGG